MVDALGNPIGFFLTGGQAHDLTGADHLLPGMEADTLIADKVFDADVRVLELLAQTGKAAVIPPKANQTVQRDYDRHLYKERHLIENFFAKLKQFRAIATRHDKTARNFLGATTSYRSQPPPVAIAFRDSLSAWIGSPYKFLGFEQASNRVGRYR